MSDFEGQGTEEVNVSEDTSSVAEDFQPDYSSLNETLNAPEPTETETPKNNPAWEPILSVVPEPLHAQIIPHLSKTDKHVQELQQKFAPYRGFIEQGIDPEMINQSLLLGQAIQQNPQAVYDQMREQFGLTHEQAIDAMNEATEDDESQGFDDEEYGDPDDSEFEFDVESHPAFVAMQEQLEQLQSIRQEQETIALQNKIAEEVNQEWQEIEKIAGGPLTQAVKEDIMQRALHIAGDGLPNLMSGFKAHVDFASAIRNSSANNSAPSVTDGTGMLPTSRTYDMSDREGMTNFIADFAKNLNGGK